MSHSNVQDVLSAFWDVEIRLEQSLNGDDVSIGYYEAVLLHVNIIKSRANSTLLRQNNISSFKIYYQISLLELIPKEKTLGVG